MAKFTAARRERFLTLLGAGRSVEEACAAAEVGRSTVTRRAARGRAPSAASDEAEFAGCFDAICDGRTDERLTSEDVMRLLERSARQGSVQAQKALLAEHRRRERVEALRGTRLPGASDAPTDEDPFAVMLGEAREQGYDNGRAS